MGNGSVADMFQIKHQTLYVHLRSSVHTSFGLEERPQHSKMINMLTASKTYGYTGGKFVDYTAAAVVLWWAYVLCYWYVLSLVVAVIVVLQVFSQTKKALLKWENKNEVGF